MATRFDIINSALSELGEPSIQSFESKRGDEIEKIYYVVRNALVSGTPWSWAVIRQPL